MKLKSSSEKDLESQARAYLALRGWHLFEKSRYPWGQGQPDIIAVRNGLCLLIELKAARPGTQLRASQERQKWSLEAAGCTLHICRSLEEVMEVEMAARSGGP